MMSPTWARRKCNCFPTARLSDPQVARDIDATTEENIPGPPNAGEGTDWFPEDASVRVWSTKNDEPSDFLVAALHENSIRCRLDKNGGRAELFVLPEDEVRAREIIREVVDGTPPE